MHALFTNTHNLDPGLIRDISPRVQNHGTGNKRKINKLGMLSSDEIQFCLINNPRL